MEVNKEQAEKCRDLGAEAMRRGDFAKATRMLSKSLQLYPLPGVEALLSQATSRAEAGTSTSSSSSQQQSSTTSSASGQSSRARPAEPQQGASNSHHSSASNGRRATPSTPDAAASTSSTATTSNGRTYTEEQVQIVQSILRAREGGRGAHYRVLGLTQTCTESEIKKAYRKISLKVHPDKNAAPQADEAFKAVGLAYATLSDTQKRTIYDRYGDEDPDNRGGGGPPGFARRGRGGGVHMHGQEVSPEDIFNMFFGMHGMGPGGAGGPGVRVYTTGFGPGGMHFQPGGRRQRRGGEQEQAQQQVPGMWNIFSNLLPMIIIMMLSFFRFSEDAGQGVGRAFMPGEQKYFSLTRNPPFSNPLQTKYSSVKDIPYFVSDKFLRTYHRDRYQLGQVERMVEAAYENYLVKECAAEEKYAKQLQARANQERDPTRKAKAMQQVQSYTLPRCEELGDLFPRQRRTSSQHRS